MADAGERLGAAVGILAGPLPNVARGLVEAGLTQVVGLSWGWDLQIGHRSAVPDEEFAWLTGLRHLIVDSEPTAQRARTLGLPAERITLIPWGVDLDTFQPDGATQTLGISDGIRVILTLRAHEEQYRTHDVLVAFAEANMTDAVLVVGGEGSLSPQYRTWVEDRGLGDRIRFIGRIEEAELAGILRRADAYVSASETDGSSVTLLQAMATGTPIIVSDIPGNAPWLDEGRAGQAFPVGDVTELARAMARVVRRGSGPDDASARQAIHALALARARADWRRNSAAIGNLLLG